MTNIIDCPNTIDTRDLQERIDELQGELDALNEALEEADQEESKNAVTAADAARVAWLEENGEELEKLTAFAKELEYCSDYKYGEILINDDYFEEYAQELAEDCGMIEHAAKWPYTCIDWEKAASELQSDYSCADLDGTTYWFRS